MSTRSMILKEQEDGSYFGVYCHCDGYLTHNGAMLIDHYNSREMVDKLISLGDLSYLAPKIEPDENETHTFDKPQRGVCIFYGRDRGEIETQATDVTLEDLNTDPWIEYTYVFGKNNEWRYFEYGRLDEGLMSVQEGVADIFKAWDIDRPQGVYGFFSKQDIQALKEKKAYCI